MELVVYITPLIGAFALIFAIFKNLEVNSKPAGNAKMIEISEAICEGAMAFLRREYRLLSIFIISAAVLLMLAHLDNPILMLQGTAFIVGAACSALAGFLGMKVATSANVRTANAARYNLSRALEVSFAGGTVMGMCVVGLSTLGLGLLFLLYSNMPQFNTDGGLENILVVLSGFSMGASSIALFARVGGGIYTKAADIGADLVGKLEEGIPEDDPRNPAVIADNVGDNVGDVAGMGADLFESYVGAIIASMIIGATLNVPVELNNAINITEKTVVFICLPFMLASIGIVSSILGTFWVRIKKNNMEPQQALNMGCYSASIIMLFSSAVAIYLFIPEHFIDPSCNLTYNRYGLFVAITVGLLSGIGIGFITEYYCAKGKAPVLDIVKSTSTGAATTIISGLSLGMRSTAIPIIFIVIATLLANYFAGLYGIALAALGMLSTTGIQLAVDAYGPIADNAGGIAEMAGLPSDVRKITDSLDAVGNTTAAIGKGFAIGSAALTAFALFSAYQTQISVALGKTVNDIIIDVSKPHVMAGVLIGAMLPFLFSSMAMNAVGKAALEMIKEVRRQFKEIIGLKYGKAKADYARCVDISTVAALREMLAPGILAILVPILIGFADATGLMLGGLLVGSISSGVLMAIFMSNSGGAWDNAKKQIEEESVGNETGKGSSRHAAAVTGDTVGDPFKDTAGPSLNILIKLMSVVALVIAPIIAKHGFHFFGN